jgi:hypothetical protein
MVTTSGTYSSGYTGVITNNTGLYGYENLNANYRWTSDGTDVFSNATSLPFAFNIEDDSTYTPTDNCVNYSVDWGFQKRYSGWVFM